VNAALRAKGLIMDPLAEWQRVEIETSDPAFVLSRYVAILALIPALAGFIGACILGVVVPGGGTVRAPIFDGILGAVFGYVESVGTVIVLALLINALVPRFGGKRDANSAFKLAVYSYTPVWLAGVFFLLPGLQFLTLSGCYGVYVLWLGLPPLMKTPAPKDRVFAAIIAVCAVALTVAGATAQRALFGTPGL
jgi:hypothetical protein